MLCIVPVRALGRFSPHHSNDFQCGHPEAATITPKGSSFVPHPFPFRPRTCLLLLVLIFSPATAQAVTAEGVVLDSAGEPVPGAQVWLVQERRGQSTLTGMDGRFEFPELAVAMTHVVARKEGHALAGHTGMLTEDAEMSIVLGPPAAVELRVVNNSFLPVAGARVRFMLVDDRFFVPAEDLISLGFPALRSDDEGALRIPGLPEDGFIKFSVTHHDYADSSVSYLPVRDEKQDIILHPGVALRGRVTHAGQGVNAAQVSIFGVLQEGPDPVSEVLTDLEGYFTVRLPAGGYRLTARHPDYASTAPKSVALELPEEAEVGEVEVTVTMELRTPRFLSGRIVAPGGGPAPGVRLFYRAGTIVYDETLTNAQGSFRLRVPEEDGVVTIVPPPGYMTEIMPDIPVQAGPEQHVTMEPLQLVELPLVQGRVLDEAGNPAPNILVTSLDFLHPVWRITDAQGAFHIQLEGMPEEAEVRFRAEHPLRFLRADFTVDLRNLRAQELQLAQFSPDLESRTVLPGQADLEMLRGEPAPEIECSEWFNSSPLSLEELRGKVVVLFLWGGFDDSITGLARLNEMRVMHLLYQDVDDVVILGVHDASSTSEEVESYLHTYGVDFPVGLDAEPFATFTNYGMVYIPQVVLIDRRGVFRYFQVEGRLPELIKTLRREAP